MPALKPGPDPARPLWWQWPTVLSLDAPAIVLAWQALVAEVAAVSIGWHERLVLALSVWLAYTVDRWIEAGRLDRSILSTPRHRFHQQWHGPIAIVAAAVLVANVAVALTTLDTRAILTGLVLAGAAALYVLSHQWLHRDAPLRVPKELCIALLLTAGVWLFTREGTGGAFWSALALFALLCLTNTALISRWETDVDRMHGQSSLALAFPAAGQHFRLLPWLTLTAAVLVAVSVDHGQPAAACTVLSAILLAAIDRLEVAVGWPLARVLADAALLTPLLVLVPA